MIIKVSGHPFNLFDQIPDQVTRGAGFRFVGLD